MRWQTSSPGGAIDRGLPAETLGRRQLRDGAGRCSRLMAWSTSMASYRLYLTNAQGRIQHGVILDCDGDDAAIAEAQRRAAGQGHELWQDARKVCLAQRPHSRTSRSAVAFPPHSACSSGRSSREADLAAGVRSVKSFRQHRARKPLSRRVGLRELAGRQSARRGHRKLRCRDAVAGAVGPR